MFQLRELLKLPLFSCGTADVGPAVASSLRSSFRGFRCGALCHSSRGGCRRRWPEMCADVSLNGSNLTMCADALNRMASKETEVQSVQVGTAPGADPVILAFHGDHARHRQVLEM